jgi:hypothetical protein
VPTAGTPAGDALGCAQRAASASSVLDTLAR